MPYGQTESDYERFDAFVKRHIEQFSKFAYFTVHDYEYAQDGIQNAMEAIMKYYDKLRDFDEQRLYRYSLAIIKHECVRAATANSRLVSTDEIEHFDAVPDDMMDNLMRDINNTTLRHCVDQLSEKYRLAILMKYYYNRTDREIAQAIDISDDSVRMILTRARQKLKKLYLTKSGEAMIL